MPFKLEIFIYNSFDAGIEQTKICFHCSQSSSFIILTSHIHHILTINITPHHQHNHLTTINITSYHTTTVSSHTTTPPSTPSISHHITLPLCHHPTPPSPAERRWRGVCVGGGGAVFRRPREHPRRPQRTARTREALCGHTRRHGGGRCGKEVREMMVGMMFFEILIEVMCFLAYFVLLSFINVYWNFF